MYTGKATKTQTTTRKPAPAPRSFTARYYAQLDRAQILRTWTQDFEGQELPVMEIRLANGATFTVGVYADPEGNGPGHIEGLPTRGI